MNVVSFGGGTNSTAMIVGMYLHKIPVDLILFADPGAEQPHTYEYIEVFDEWLVKHGLPKITTVHCVDKDGNRLTLDGRRNHFCYNDLRSVYRFRKQVRRWHWPRALTKARCGGPWSAGWRT